MSFPISCQGDPQPVLRGHMAGEGFPGGLLASSQVGCLYGPLLGFQGVARLLPLWLPWVVLLRVPRGLPGWTPYGFPEKSS